MAALLAPSPGAPFFLQLHEETVEDGNGITTKTRAVAALQRPEVVITGAIASNKGYCTINTTGNPEFEAFECHNPLNLVVSIYFYLYLRENL